MFKLNKVSPPEIAKLFHSTLTYTMDGLVCKYLWIFPFIISFLVSLNIVNIVVKLENTADHRLASDQLTQSSRYYQIRCYQAQNSLYWYGVSTAIFLLCSSSGARPCIFKCRGQVWSWLKNYPNYIWTRSFDPKLRRADALICAVDTWIVVGSDKTKLKWFMNQFASDFCWCSVDIEDIG